MQIQSFDQNLAGKMTQASHNITVNATKQTPKQDAQEDKPQQRK